MVIAKWGNISLYYWRDACIFQFNGYKQMHNLATTYISTSWEWRTNNINVVINLVDH